MQEEIEIKVIIMNPDEVEAILRKKAKFIKEKKQKDEYFVLDHRDFFRENPTKKYLRIRYEPEENSIGYHYCHFNEEGSLLKTDEYETKIENPEIMHEILERIGIKRKVTVTKHRKYFHYEDFEIVIDNIKELGFFLEIEAKIINDSLEKTKEKCYKVLEKLGIKWKKAPNTGYPDMILNQK